MVCYYHPILGLYTSTVRSEYLGSILGDIAGKSYGETPEKYQTRCTSRTAQYSSRMLNGARDGGLHDA